MPPNSMCEWILGQNVVPKKKNGDGSGLRQVVSLEVLTDDESGDDVYCVSVPRREKAKAAPKASQASASSATAAANNKKVRFVEEKPKSAMKQPPPYVSLESHSPKLWIISSGATDNSKLRFTPSLGRRMRPHRHV